MDEAQGQRTGFVRRNIMVFLLAVVLVAGLIGTVLPWHTHRQDLTEQKSEISDVQSKIAAIHQKDDERIDSDVADSLGIDRSRLSRDTETISQLVSTALTWHSGQDYENARKELVDHYGVSADSQLLTGFLGVQKYNLDDKGSKVYYIDTAGLASQVDEDPDVEIVRVRGDLYTYDVRVNVSTTSKGVSSETDATGEADELPAGERLMVLRLTVNGKGAVVDATGDAAHGATRHSG